MLKKIIDRLQKRDLHGWQIREMHKTSHQSFLAKENRECVRSVDTLRYEITVYRTHAGRDKSDVLGFSSFRVGHADTVTLDKVIDVAILAADLVSNQPFELPEQQKDYPTVDICEKRFSPEVLIELENRIQSAVSKEKNIRLSAAEFFMDRIETRLINHKGLDVQQEETMLHSEFILLAKAAAKENEYIDRYSRRLLKDFNLEQEVKESSDFARNATISVLPKTGAYPVLMSGEPLDHLFNPVLARASARLKYNRMLEVELGKSVTVDGALKGDAISLWSRGRLPGALGTNRFDSYGTPACDVKLIDKNKVNQLLADQRYADYLSIPVTGELGNVEVEKGETPFKKLIDDALQKYAAVIHLEAFSAFEPNPITGAYSAEIRSGFEITKRGVRPIKGGSVSGEIQKDLLNCRLSSETSLRERILCPQGICFDQLEIAGE